MDAAYQDILYENRGSATWITLNRPARRNAVRPQTNRELTDAFHRAAYDESTSAVVLTGAGAGFCAGDDIQEIFMAEGLDERIAAIQIGRYLDREQAHVRVLAEIIRCEKPVIAAVNGAAVGLGLDLALVCDMRIAAESARFGSFFVRRGIVGTMGTTYFLPRIVGLSRALELAMTGDLIDAAEADRIGLVSRVVSSDGLIAGVEELLERLSWGAPLAQRIIKRVMIRGLSMPWEEFDEYAGPLSDGMWRTEDCLEGATAYVERRPPRFKGR
jgi:enoyl-CoA hydratase/carnithine racemase